MKISSPIRSILMVSLMLVCASALGLTASPAQAAKTQMAAVPVTLASQGQAKLDIVISAKASDAVKADAATLAEYLGKITGGTYKVTQGDGATGIVVGTMANFPSLKLQKVLTAKSVAGREQYLLRSHPGGLYVIGQTDLAVNHAVWDLLDHLGYRQFFPGPDWEIIPHKADLKLAINSLQTPDYLYRRVWYGFGLWGYNNQPYQDWIVRNRMVSAFKLTTGHAYGNIIRHNKALFTEHPEYYALVNGKRTGSKMCISNPGVQQLVVDYAKKYFKDNPNADCISMEPSDGAGWCECDKCQALGSPSDRALILCNKVSEYLENNNLPDKYVAMYAYASHSPPPTKVKARPRVIVNVATSFLRGGYSTVELLDGWRAQGVQQLGIREYYSVNMWDRDLPGRARGSNLDYLARTIPDFFRRGAVFMTAEASDNWGPNGLGYYLASRMLWDVNQAQQIDELKQDFYTKAFGKAAGPMAKFYETIDGTHRPMLSSPLLGKMYRLLSEASQLADSPAVQYRINDLILYTRYVELYRNYSMAQGKERQAGFETLIRHAYQMRKTMMVHTRALYRDLSRRDKSVSIPAEAAWRVPEDKNPWKSSEPFKQDVLNKMVSQGMENNPPLAFEPVDFPGKLLPAAKKLDFDSLPVLEMSSRSRGKVVYHLWFNAPTTLNLKVTGGMIAHYRDRGPTHLKLYAGIEDPGALEDEKDVNNDGKPYDVALKVKDTGLQVLTISDGSDMSQIDFPKGVAPTIEFSADRGANLNGRSSAYFYVPKGTRLVGGYYQSSGATIYDALGKPALKIAQSGYFSVEVPPGQDGKLWSVRNLQGRIMFMTVPPFVSGDPASLLLPESILIQDGQK